jgi:hypothetical protein
MNTSYYLKDVVTDKEWTFHTREDVDNFMDDYPRPNDLIFLYTMTT